jgi:hypothetical protein
LTSVPLPNRLSVKTSTERDVDYWGVGGEARFGKGAEPVPGQGGYLFRFAYVGIGGDVRAIDQDNRLNLRGDGFSVNQIKYSESLDTTYAGAYLSIGGEYNILGYLGIGGSWGLRSLISLRTGVYDATTRAASRRMAALRQISVCPTTRSPLSARRASRHESNLGRGRACHSLPTTNTTRLPLR